MADEKCCCFKTLLVLWLTIPFGILHAVTPPILNVDPSTIILIKVAMVVAVICAILALFGIRKDAPNLMKPAILLNIVVQAYLLLQIFYSIAGFIFPSLALPEIISTSYVFIQWKTLGKIVSRFIHFYQRCPIRHATYLCCAFDHFYRAVRNLVLILLVKCFYEIKAKRYRPVPTTVFKMPPRPLVVVKTGADGYSTETGKSPENQDATIQMS